MLSSIDGAFSRREADARRILEEIRNVGEHIRDVLHFSSDISYYSEGNMHAAGTCFVSRAIPVSEETRRICIDVLIHMGDIKGLPFMCLPLGMKMFALYEGKEEIGSAGRHIVRQCLRETVHEVQTPDETSVVIKTGLVVLRQHNGRYSWVQAYLLLVLVADRLEEVEESLGDLCRWDLEDVDSVLPALQSLVERGDEAAIRAWLGGMRFEEDFTEAFIRKLLISKLLSRLQFP
jgi:hypothetical protein